MRITNQKELREFCNLSGCEVWQAIIELEHLTPRTPLRLHCVHTCTAYKLVKHLDTTNKRISPKEGKEKYK